MFIFCGFMQQAESDSQMIENTLKGKSTVKKTNNPTTEEEPQQDQNEDIFKSSPLVCTYFNKSILICS